MSRYKKDKSVPSVEELFIPLVKALQNLNGSGSIEEINNKIHELESYSEEILQIPHGDEGGQCEIDYRIAWARTYLKKYGILENSSRGIWALINSNINLDELDPKQIKKQVIENQKIIKNDNIKLLEDVNNIDNEFDETDSWKEKLLSVLYLITPNAFERLAQRILRESGFIHVEVTGKSGDGGIDGKGIMRINGLLSFHVIFQCKRYKGSVTPSQIRDFRGAMQGRADKGLFITTGSFTREAVKEATRDGAPPIDLIDGELLCDKLKELNLGVFTKIKSIEVVEIKNEWFENI
jgi:restriction system protein